jgi:L,D-transpeptidase ErfK/SrfK
MLSMIGMKRLTPAVVALLAITSGGMAAANELVGQVEYYTAAHDDTMLDLARKNNLGFVELMIANPGIDPWLPGEGTRIVLPRAHILPEAPRKGVVINLADMRLYYFGDNGRLKVTHPIGIGRDGYTTPLGATTIVRKKKDPTWTPTAAIRAENPDLPAFVPPGPDNPMGKYALYLGWPAYAVHGTNQPFAVGRRVSAGCIRLYPEHIEQLFTTIPVGTQVTVVHQPVKFAWLGPDLYMQAHVTGPDVDRVEEGEPIEAINAIGVTQRLLKAAGDATDRIDWPAVQLALQKRDGIPARVTLPPARALTPQVSLY